MIDPGDCGQLEAAEEQRDLSSRLREARLTLGLTQQDAATVAGVSRSAIAEMESGRRRVSALELRRLARLYRRPVAWLIGEEDDSDPDPATDDFMIYPGAGDQLIFVSGTGNSRLVVWLTQEDPPSALQSRDRDRAILRALLGLAQRRLDAIETDAG